MVWGVVGRNRTGLLEKMLFHLKLIKGDEIGLSETRGTRAFQAIRCSPSASNSYTTAFESRPLLSLWES